MSKIEVGERETVICHAEGLDFASISSSERKFIGKIKKLAAQYPEDTKLIENPDGSVYLQFPIEWFKMPHPPRQMSDEAREKAAERMRGLRRNGT